jgi:ElaB/YqjD/DUF883 family membrane-anchored ribosome-binding protein
MLARSSYSRGMAIDLDTLERRLRSIEATLERSGERFSASASGAAESLKESVASALNMLAGQVRSGATSMSYEAGKLGGEAARLGNVAVRRVVAEVEHRPLMMLAAAVGIGVLLGLASQRRSNH